VLLPINNHKQGRYLRSLCPTFLYDRELPDKNLHVGKHGSKPITETGVTREVTTLLRAAGGCAALEEPTFSATYGEKKSLTYSDVYFGSRLIPVDLSITEIDYPVANVNHLQIVGRGYYGYSLVFV